MVKKTFRIAISKKKKGRVSSFKLVEATSVESILKGPKSRFVGPGRFIVGAMPTRLRGSLSERLKLPRSKRFGKGFE